MFEIKIVESLKKILPFSEDEIKKLIRKSNKKKYGDYVLPCFSLVKHMKGSPSEIAKEIVRKIQLSDCFDYCLDVNGYVNFILVRSVYYKYVLMQISEKKRKYGFNGEGENKTCLIEHTSINPNASPHVGRARNAIIGDFIFRAMKSEGYDAKVHYFVNDIGKQISMLVLAGMGIKEVKFSDLLALYTEINGEINKNPILEKRVFQLLYAYENGDHSLHKKFREIVDICIKGQTKIFNDLGIYYDYFDYESQFLFNNALKEIVKKIDSLGLLFEDEKGRYVINLDSENMPPLVITRGDKTSLYPLRDIAYTIWKSDFHADKNIIVLGQDQQLYFKQVSKAIEKLGYRVPEVVFYSFVMLAEGKMSTRQGKIVLLEDFMRKAVYKVQTEIERRYGDTNATRAKHIAYAAVRYSIGQSSIKKNVIFNCESSLDYSGNSGPYVLYAYVRIKSILRKCEKVQNIDCDYLSLTEDAEYDLVRLLDEFPNVMKRAKTLYSPHVLIHYTYRLARKFSVFYHKCSVLKGENEKIKEVRIVLIQSIKQVFENVFYVLGIEPIDVM